MVLASRGYESEGAKPLMPERQSPLPDGIRSPGQLRGPDFDAAEHANATRRRQPLNDFRKSATGRLKRRLPLRRVTDLNDGAANTATDDASLSGANARHAHAGAAPATVRLRKEKRQSAAARPETRPGSDFRSR